DQVKVVTTLPITGVNFALVANARVTGNVTKRSDGTAMAGASVYFSRTSNASGSPAFTATTDASGNYTQAVQNGIWYVCAGKTGFYTSADKTITMTGVDVANINFALAANTRNIPRTADLLFSAITESLPASGATGNWATYMPSGQTLTAMGSPTVEIVNGQKLEKNLYADGDGFLQGAYTAPITINGATIVVAVKPLRNGISTSWISCVDIFYNRLVIGVRNNTGQVLVKRNDVQNESATAIPDGQITILTLIVQPDGTYKVWANGVLIMNITSTSAMILLDPKWNGGATGFWSYINVGRNNPDGWTTFNGNIGDVFVYKVALTDVPVTGERQQLEADLTAKFLTTDWIITASAGANACESRRKPDIHYHTERGIPHR
ncbi:MAG: carboxypeptidase-like regulatory domain-containing protein, partial [Armatimonadetes bacterium]|nr:carboxypeptidase-like regulatory domain-containing protein [Armatimonadota bacterium]